MWAISASLPFKWFVRVMIMMLMNIKKEFGSLLVVSLFYHSSLELPTPVWKLGVNQEYTEKNNRLLITSSHPHSVFFAKTSLPSFKWMSMRITQSIKRVSTPSTPKNTVLGPISGTRRVVDVSNSTGSIRKSSNIKQQQNRKNWDRERLKWDVSISSSFIV